MSQLTEDASRASDSSLNTQVTREGSVCDSSVVEDGFGSSISQVQSVSHLNLTDLGQGDRFWRQAQGQDILPSVARRPISLGDIQFMCTRYGKSRKSNHRIFLKFVELKIEELEQTGQQVPVTAPAASTNLPAELNLTGNHGLQLRPKAKAKSKTEAAKPSTRQIATEEEDQLGGAKPRCPTTQ